MGLIGTNRDGCNMWTENIKEKKVHTPVQEYSTINFHEDNYMNFSEAPTYDAIEQLKEANRVVE